MARVMTSDELKRRKKLQAGISVTTSTLGLAALGMKGGSVAAGRVARTARKADRALPKIEGFTSGHALKAKKYGERQQKLNSAALNTGIVSSGIGGVGGYNFASYTAAEGRKKKPTATVVKNWEPAMDFGLNGVHQGRNVLLPPLKPQEVAKAYDPERNRQRRIGAYATGASIGSGAAAFGAVHHGRKAVGRAPTSVKIAGQNMKVGGTGLRASEIGAFKGGLKRAGVAAGLGATAAGLAIGSERIRSYKKGKGGSYRPLAQIRMS